MGTQNGSGLYAGGSCIHCHCSFIHFFNKPLLRTYGKQSILLGTGGMEENKTWLQILESTQSGGEDRQPSHNENRVPGYGWIGHDGDTKELGRRARDQGPPDAGGVD